MAEEIVRWLETLGLGQYAQNFTENSVEIGHLTYLTDDDLKELGLPLGPRRRLQAAIRSFDVETAPSRPDARRAKRNVSSIDAEAERRQLTVMFVDLVGSTSLSAELDPEDMAAIIRVFQNCVAGEISRFGGYVAKFMGDGVLAYFGWPQAHEDAAERAIRSGLAIVDAVYKIPSGNRTLACRVGVATGLVVVGEVIGEGSAQEQTVVGDTPNLAARLQALANPGEIVISETSRALLGISFDMTDLGPQKIRGLSEPVGAYVVKCERLSGSRFEASHVTAPLPMFGRNQELELLLERWAQAKSGEGQGLLLVGEAGIGKSRITRALLDSVADEPHTRIRYQCSPYHADSPFWPIIQQLKRGANLDNADTEQTKRYKLEALLALAGETSSLSLFAALLSIDGSGSFGAMDVSPKVQREQIMRAIVGQFVGLSSKLPVLVILEDAHWIDPTSLELIKQALDAISGIPAFMLITSRPDNQPELAGHPHVTRLTLNRLGRAGVEAIVHRLGGSTLPVATVDAIITRTDGVPLFVEELTKAVVETGKTAIPASLHDSLMARLDRFPEVKTVAQTAACIGREFDLGLLTALSEKCQSDIIRALDQLTASELVFRRGTPSDARYMFKHALVRDAAYESLLKARRRQLHLRLLQEYKRRAAPCEILAQHAQAGELYTEAVEHWQRAGRASVFRPAYAEAIAQFENAISLVRQHRPMLKWQRRELELLIDLSQAIVPKYGQQSPEVASVFGQAKTLMDTIGDKTYRAAIGYGLWTGHFMSAEHGLCGNIASKLVEDVERDGDDRSKIVANRLLATTYFSQGKFRAALKHLDRGIKLYKPELRGDFEQSYIELSTQVYTYQMQCLWLAGYPDQSNEAAEKAINVTNEVKSPGTEAYLNHQLICLCSARQEIDRLREVIKNQRKLAERVGMTMNKVFADAVAPLVGSVGTTKIDPAAVEQGYKRLHSLGIVTWTPMIKGFHASRLLAEGDAASARTIGLEALNIVNETDERWYEAELLRLLGEAYSMLGNAKQAEGKFGRSLTVAREQEAKSWELRTGISLARFWQHTSRRKDAQEMLTPIYNWFTEGFGTRDLMEAKKVLGELRS